MKQGWKLQWSEENGMKWLQFDLLLQFPKLRHGVFSRLGGASEGCMSALNVSWDVGDSEENVSINRSKIAQALELPGLIAAKQVHGVAVWEVRGCEEVSREADALTTRLPGIGIMIQHADCQAALVYDPVNHAAGGFHCGWRGSVGNIYQAGISFMQKTYRSDPRNLHVAIGPSLGPRHAEFIEYRKELPKWFWNYQVAPLYFDFWEISRHQLIECGILPHHIQIAEVCTYSHPELFFSYRRDKATGRNGSIIGLL